MVSVNAENRTQLPMDEDARNVTTEPPHRADGAADPLQLLTPEDLCDLLKVRRSWVYDTVEAGGLPVVRLGRQLRFRRRDVVTFIDSLAGARR